MSSSDLQNIKKDLETIKTDIALIKQDIVYIKDRVSKVEGILYSLGAVVILGVVTVIMSFFVRVPLIK